MTKKKSNVARERIFSEKVTRITVEKPDGKKVVIGAEEKKKSLFFKFKLFLNRSKDE